MNQDRAPLPTPYDIIGPSDIPFSLSYSTYFIIILVVTIVITTCYFLSKKRTKVRFTKSIDEQVKETINDHLKAQRSHTLASTKIILMRYISREMSNDTEIDFTRNKLMIIKEQSTRESVRLAAEALIAIEDVQYSQNKRSELSSKIDSSLKKLTEIEL